MIKMTKNGVRREVKSSQLMMYSVCVYDLLRECLLYEAGNWLCYEFIIKNNVMSIDIDIVNYQSF